MCDENPRRSNRPARDPRTDRDRCPLSDRACWRRSGASRRPPRGRRSDRALRPRRSRGLPGPQDPRGAHLGRVASTSRRLPAAPHQAVWMFLPNPLATPRAGVRLKPHIGPAFRKPVTKRPETGRRRAGAGPDDRPSRSRRKFAPAGRPRLPRTRGHFGRPIPSSHWKAGRQIPPPVRIVQGNKFNPPAPRNRPSPLLHRGPALR